MDNKDARRISQATQLEKVFEGYRIQGKAMLEGEVYADTQMEMKVQV